MRFTKQDILKLIESYGRAFYNPSLSENSKRNFVKIIKNESFPSATIEELLGKFDFLYNKYQSVLNGNEKSFEYFSSVDKAVNLAQKDFKSKETIVDDDKNNPNDVPVKKPKIKSVKQEGDKNIQPPRKRVKFDDNTVEIPYNDQSDANEIHVVKIEESALKDIGLNLTNAVLDCLKQKNDEKFESLTDSVQSLKNELRSVVQNGTALITQTIMKKEKDKRLSDIYIMMKTLIDEQREANENVIELKTIFKSISAGQNLLYDLQKSRYEKERNNEKILKHILSIIKKND